MPKRKKSHEYCRNRFGIFSKRRRVSSTDHRCEECVNRAAALAARQRRKTVDKPGEVGPPGTHLPVHESPCRGAVSHPISACDCNQFGVETSTPAPWTSSGNSPLSVSRNINVPSGPVGALPTTTLEEIAPTESGADVMMSSSCGSSSAALDTNCAKSFMELGRETDEGRLVALTSSLKLTEGAHLASVSDSLLSEKMPMDISTVQELTPQVPVVTQCSADHTSASTSVLVNTLGSHSRSVSHRTVHMHAGVYEPRRHVGSHRLLSRHGQRVQPPAPRVDVVRELRDDSDDSDEGFCEPVAKRSHRLPTGRDSTAEPDEGVNVVEESLPSPMRHRRSLEYTNHSLDASLGFTCSLYWQMMSNQYGVPTKIYTMERSHISPPFDRQSCSNPRASVNLNWESPMLGWTQKPVVSASPSSNISFDHHDFNINGKSSSMDCEQQSGIFAIGNLLPDRSNVDGTVGMCLQRAVHCNKSVFVFDPRANPSTPEDGEASHWYQYSRSKFRFVPCQTVPVLTPNFAGLGANELTESARLAIKAVFRETFGAP